MTKRTSPIVLIQPLPCATNYIDQLCGALKELKASSKLSIAQKLWLTTVLMGIVITRKLSWAAFERSTLNECRQDGLRWMFSHSKIPWNSLIYASTKVLIKHYGVTSGTLTIDDSDKMRSRNTRKIAHVHKVRDKSTGGYGKGQEFIFMVIVTNTVTIPVDFRFYTPDPELSAWKQENNRLKKQKVPTKQRPKRPSPDADYPTKEALALVMLRHFSDRFPEIHIKIITADALYCTGSFMDKSNQYFPRSQVVTQLRKNQSVRCKNGNWTSLKTYFARNSGVDMELIVRGRENKKVTMLGHRLEVKAHGKKRFIIALKYEGESEYRYLVASHLSWRAIDIARAYTLRWIIEVFIEDWKSHCGWNTLSKQQGVEGASRGVILSLLCDHMLLLHPEQSARLKSQHPGLPVGCMIERIKAEALIVTIEKIVVSDNPKDAFNYFSQALVEALPDRPSSKHMAGCDLGRQEPTESLKYQMAA
ncbi:MAG: transposase [Alteromonadaceae bacterium]|nr:MAG: transposase [Alteromonadaceae bacterium]